MRADQLLVERGLAGSRSQAQRLIAGGLLWRTVGDWRAVGKNGDDIPQTAELRLLDLAQARYVSRGGLKLEGALAATGLMPTGWTALDVGQSTGGFTDCLLRQGARRVLGVDVGQGQLHASLRADPRVLGLQGLNARHLTATQLIAASQDAIRAGGQKHQEIWQTLEDQFELIVGDLSFISLTLVLPVLRPLLKPSGHLLMLVKPQFELQPSQIGKGGIVRDASLYALVEQRLRDCCQRLALDATDWLDSPIPGGDGNREFFIHARATGVPPSSGSETP